MCILITFSFSFHISFKLLKCWVVEKNTNSSKWFLNDFGMHVFAFDQIL